MEQKQFFLPGDMVTLRQDIPNKPIMLVVKKVTSNISLGKKDEGTIKKDYFQGILCRWFTMHGVMQEAIFNTKDLQKEY